MEQVEGRARARRAVLTWLGEKGKPQSWLARTASVDPGTVNEFLQGNRWPANVTRAKIEAALGWEVGTIMAIAEGATTPEIDPPQEQGQRRYYLTPTTEASDDELVMEIMYRLKRARVDIAKLQAQVEAGEHEAAEHDGVTSSAGGGILRGREGPKNV